MTVEFQWRILIQVHSIRIQSQQIMHAYIMHGIIFVWGPKQYDCSNGYPCGVCMTSLIINVMTSLIGCILIASSAKILY